MPVLNTDPKAKYQGGKFDPKRWIDAVIPGRKARQLREYLKRTAGDYQRNAQGCPITTDRFAHYHYELDALFQRLKGDRQLDLETRPVLLVEAEYLKAMNGGRLPEGKSFQAVRLFDCVNADYFLLTRLEAEDCGISGYWFV